MERKLEEAEKLARDMLEVAGDHDFIWYHDDCVLIAREFIFLLESARRNPNGS